MKHILFLICLFLSFSALSQDDFQLEINDSLVVDIQENEDYFVTIDGQPVKFRLSEKDTLLYQDDMVNFQHLKEYKVSKVEVDEDIEQLVMISAEGSGVLIQKYYFMNPELLENMMLSEITKESISYGYEEEIREYERTLSSGETITVKQSILTYRDETEIYEIASVGGKDYGLLILTMEMVDEDINDGEKIVGLMWETLNFIEQE